ncbi:amino acid adenylation domain-containing protein [Nocardiopsis sp. Huas11]|uniref:non-ribosomal peptide synthetase n=1 Tax=Nocardiopsis sp. Huas11 TaxID=2183912 RepID=UPI000EB2F0E9|nr:non-ribosomal peptide synthetase [Nocardiopsis sp. Huas11]RKS08424.1 amino acid adenylation domain-containing protein [Nocardiopsis sp. Huas11]
MTSPDSAAVRRSPPTSLHTAVDAVAERAPHRWAVLGESESLTYSALVESSDALAGVLRRAGAVPGTVVGVQHEALTDLAVGLLAVLKAGAAYLPLSARTPPTRAEAMLDEAGAAFVLAGPGFDETWGAGRTVVRLGDSDGGRTPPPPLPAHPEQLCSVLFTSGTTGTPRAVGLTHRGLLARFSHQAYLDLRPGDRVARVGDVMFDILAFELWGTLLAGATVVDLPGARDLSPVALATAVQERGVTVLHLTSAWFAAFVRRPGGGGSGLRHLLFGGEAPEADAVRTAYADPALDARLTHMYGPTETTSFATAHAVERPPAPEERLTAGRPLPGTDVFVLDGYGGLLPPGIPGEVWIGGPGVARGYLNRPGRTAEHFLPHPFARTPGERLYRTGDRARIRADGRLELLGRLDGQLKVRGHRVEPEEVERALRTLAGVRSCVVTVQGEGGSARLVAYYTPTASPVDETALRAALLTRLPRPLVPDRFVAVRALPLTERGKVDRAALRDSAMSTVSPPPQAPPARAAAPGTDVGSGRGAGTTDTEQTLLALFRELLARTEIGRDDDFLACGGTSILAMSLVSRIEEELDVRVPLTDVFDHPTPAGLAWAVNTAEPPDCTRGRGETDEHQALGG